MRVAFEDNELIVDNDKFTWELPEGITAKLKKSKVQGFNDYGAEDLFGEYDFPSVELSFGPCYFGWGTNENKSDCVYLMLIFVSTHRVPFSFKREFIDIHLGEKVYPIRVYRNTYHQYEDKNEPLTVGKLIKQLSQLDPNLKVSIATTADCGYVHAGGRVHDIIVEDNGEWVTFYSEESLDYDCDEDEEI